MQVVDVLKSHADECQRMASSVRDPNARESWRRMAARWQHCAQIAQSAQDAVARHHSDRKRRNSTPGWAAQIDRELDAGDAKAVRAKRAARKGGLGVRQGNESRLTG